MYLYKLISVVVFNIGCDGAHRCKAAGCVQDVSDVGFIQFFYTEMWKKKWRNAPDREMPGDVWQGVRK